MKTLLTALLCLTFPFFSPAQTKAAGSRFHLTGVIKNSSPASKVYLLYQTDGRRMVDSSVVIKNHFSFKGITAEPTFATLCLDHDGRGLKAAMRKMVDELDVLKFYLHPGEIEIAATDSISTAKFVKSAINRDYAKLKTLENIQAEHLLVILSANMQRQKNAASEKRYVAFYDSLKAANRPVLKRFAIDYPTSFIALVALKEYAGAFPDLEEIVPLFKKLSPSIQNSAAGRDFDALLKSSYTIAVGKPAPDFIQADTMGTPVSLSSFKGKYVLIDFWASWCGPCRADNPGWVKAYEQLKAKNFAILGVSLDGHDTRKAWLKAIKTDSLTWTQVSDLKHWDNAVAKQYGINAIPQNVLVTPDGKIAAKNIEPGDLVKLIENIK